MPREETSGTNSPGAINTAAAQTVMAQLTQIAAGITPTSAPVNPTEPGETPQEAATPTQRPADTEQPASTATQAPTAGPAATATSGIPCNRIEFVEDVTVEDGDSFPPGTEFTKTWRLRNNGSCTWTTDYKVVFLRGDTMRGSDFHLPEAVEPGETADISIDLVAPANSGEYAGFWLMADPDNNRFGTGARGDSPFWVEIVVEEADEGMGFSFTESYCSAEWESDEGDLDCPGDDDDNDGFVIRLNEPDLENRSENEPTLWTQPSNNENGWITGTFPRFTVRSGDRFLADIGCLEGYEDCDVLFQVRYLLDGETEYRLGEWHETYDEEITRVELDLTPLADQNVRFMLVVLTNGDGREDAAFWLNPHIAR
jgi:hypothetical protein